jgi:hypothetical protein
VSEVAGPVVPAVPATSAAWRIRVHSTCMSRAAASCAAAGSLSPARRTAIASNTATLHVSRRSAAVVMAASGNIVNESSHTPILPR